MPAMLDLECLQCGQAFTAPKKRRGRHPGFCSDACRRAAARDRASGFSRAHELVPGGPARPPRKYRPRARPDAPNPAQPSLFDGL